MVPIDFPTINNACMDNRLWLMHTSASTSIFKPPTGISLNLSITNSALRNIGLYQSSLLYPRTIWSTIDDASDTTDMFPVIMELEWSVYRPRSRSMRDVDENKLDEVMDVEETSISRIDRFFFYYFFLFFFFWWRFSSLNWNLKHSCEYFIRIYISLHESVSR